MDFSWDAPSIMAAKKANLLRDRLAVKTKRGTPDGADDTATPQKRQRLTQPRTPTTSSPMPSSSRVLRATRDDPGMIKIGSDCSGLGAELYAMAALGLEHRVDHAFASELDKAGSTVTSSLLDLVN